MSALEELLARFGWLPDLGYGQVVYRDRDNRRALLHVRPTSGGMVLVLPQDRLMVFTSLEAGHLRGAVRHAVNLRDRPPDDGPVPAGVSWRAA